MAVDALKGWFYLDWNLFSTVWSSLMLIFEFQHLSCCRHSAETASECVANFKEISLIKAGMIELVLYFLGSLSLLDS